MTDPTKLPKGYAFKRWDLGYGPEKYATLALDGPAGRYADYSSTEDAAAACHRHRNRVAAEALREAAMDVRADDEATDEDYDTVPGLPGIVDDRGLIRARDAVRWLLERARELDPEGEL